MKNYRENREFYFGKVVGTLFDQIFGCLIGEQLSCITDM